MIKIKDKRLVKYFFFLGWIFLWGTLSFNPETFKNAKAFDFSLINYKEIISLIRGSSTIVFGIILSIFLILNLKKINFLKKNLFLFYLFFLIFFLQALPYFQYDLSVYNLYFLYNSVLALIILILTTKYSTKNEMKIIMYINLSFLTIICIYFGSEYFFNYFYFKNSFYSLWGVIDTNTMNFEIPRPTGLSRSFLIIYIFITYINFETKKFLIFKKILQIISIVFIILLSSRSTIFLLIFVIFLDLLLIRRNKINLYNTIIYKLIFPMILVFLIIFFKSMNFEKNKSQDSEFLSQNSTFNLQNLRKYEKYDPSKPKTDFSSGRLEDWKNLIKLNKNFFLGYGVMGDRFLISQSASNGILYTYASAGFIGALFFVFLSIMILLNSLKIIFINLTKSNKFELISAISIIIILMRSVLETSYAVFGIDFLILSSSLAILIKFKNE